MSDLLTFFGDSLEDELRTIGQIAGTVTSAHIGFTLGLPLASKIVLGVAGFYTGAALGSLAYLTLLDIDEWLQDAESDLPKHDAA
jgi:hypothetical protein